MDLATFHELLSGLGRSAIRQATALAPTEASYLQDFTKLNKLFPAELSRAALETVLLRGRAQSRHSRASLFYFTREALEQSSSEAVSRYRAKRFAKYGTVLDLCCGSGMDAIALAEAGCTVHAVDSDPVKLAMAESNAAAAGVSDRVSFHLGDVLTLPLPSADAAFVDPSRRSGERRHLNPAEYQPPLDSVLARFPRDFPIGVKIAPGVARPDFEYLDAEAEFVTSDGELKECALWFGGLKSAERRATILSRVRGRLGRASNGVENSCDSLSLAGGTPADPGAQPPGSILFDPDSSVIRADLLGLLAEQLDAAPLEPGIALLAGSELIPTPFATAFRIEACIPFKVESLREQLRTSGVGRVTILKRALDVDVNAVQKKLKLAGTEHRHIILTKAGGKPAAIIATIAE